MYSRWIPFFAKQAIVHREIGERLLERLQPPVTYQHIADMGAAQIYLPLAGYFPHGQVRSFHACADVHTHYPEVTTAQGITVPAEQGAFDLIFSNVYLSSLPNPQGRLFLDHFAYWKYLLRQEGVLLFSCLGENSATALREIWSSLDAYAHFNPLPSIHQLGDALHQAGFSKIVMDKQDIALHYRDPATLLDDLRITAGSLWAEPKMRGLYSPRKKQQLLQAIGQDFSLSLQVFYGFAMHQKRAPKPTAEASFPLHQLRQTR